MGFNSFAGIKKFNILNNDIQLERQVSPQTYCESVGRKSAILGFERGIFEIWVYPFKIVTDLQFSIFIPQYNLLVTGSDIAKRIVVRPELTTIVFSHEVFTLEQHLLTPLHEPGCIMLLDINTNTPLELWVSFVPNLLPMWPAGLGGQYTQWLDELNAYYIGEASKRYVALIGSPLAKKLSNTPGHQLPEQPMKFVIQVTQKTAAESLIPIIITGSMAGNDAVVKQYQDLLNTIPESYQQNYDYYQRFGADFMSIKSPLLELDLAYEWAKVSLDKGLVHNPQLGKGLVAGYGVSGKTQRPGFAWFFGGDAFLNSFAITSYGDFELTKTALTLLRDNQRGDGKIFHELTQSAALLNWFQDYPYGFYHAETSAFYIVAMDNYFRRSGDESFIRESWESIKKAYYYCISADEDQDGLMENRVAGLAAMEVGEMLQQNQVDVYLASLWLQALKCMLNLSQVCHDPELHLSCQQQFDKALDSFNNVFVDTANKQLNFALLTTGEKLPDPTVWQSLPLFFNLIDDDTVAMMFQKFSSSEMSTDWGPRGVSNQSKYYDPISYNNGTVWPFTTGYVATAQYRHHRAINGWHNLLANVRMTWLDALGWHPELLSGEYYRPLTTAVPHQLFSATGIILPLVQGLLGLESDFQAKQVTFSPHLPLDWTALRVNNYRCGEDIFNFTVHRSRNMLNLEAQHLGPRSYTFIFSPALGLASKIETVTVNSRSVNFLLKPNQYDLHCEIQSELADQLSIQVKFCPGIEFSLPLPDLHIGSYSKGLKLIDYELSHGVLTMTLEGMSGCNYEIPFITGYQIDQVDGGIIKSFHDNFGILEVRFESQPSFRYIKKVIRLMAKIS